MFFRRPYTTLFRSSVWGHMSNFVDIPIKIKLYLLKFFELCTHIFIKKPINKISGMYTFQNLRNIWN